ELKGGRVQWQAPAEGAIELLCRPERFTVVEAGQGTLTGTVVAAFFLGDRIRLILDGVAEEPVVVEAGHGRDFAPGDLVHLALDPAGLLLLDA
ncbi:MAG TPA: TOBE domain-containing protein, partial [Alphaproteobacteria bacterium]|nr:TOBE domain-containing protein [Alphaproteobacteria bacterium]